MSVVRFESRLRKVEAQRPMKATFFMAWGKDETDLERLVNEARQTGKTHPGDIGICAVWPGKDAPPPSRWVAGRDIKDLTDSEVHAFDDIMQSMLDVVGEADKTPPDDGLKPHMLQYSNSQLFFMTFGRTL